MANGPSQRRGGGARWLWLVAMVIAAGGAGWFYWQGRTAEVVPVIPPPVPETTTSTVTTSTLPPPRPDLPPLAESDATIEGELRGLGSGPLWEAALGSGAIVRRIVTATVNVADGESPRDELPFLAPQGKFVARRQGERSVIDPASYARYDAVANVVASIDATAAVKLYREFWPLFDAAYAELGRPDRSWDATLRAAIARLLRVPVTDRPLELVRQVETWALADPVLEDLSVAEKHLLRMGSRNARLVQAKLRELQTALDTPP